MAGYLFSLNNEDSLFDAIENGCYSTFMNEPNRTVWSIPVEGTFADFCTMKEGDNVYFFIRRKIYGIGKLINIQGDCKYFNFPTAGLPEKYNGQEVLVDFGVLNKNSRFICFFEPSPYFFSKGIDMDEVLSSAPNDFIILRAFWKLSFIKFSDKENQAFKDIILRRNYDAFKNPVVGENVFKYKAEQIHSSLYEKNLDNYKMKIQPLLKNITNNDNSLRHEMMIEAGLLYQLANENPDTISIFGHWQYLTHQVIASPFKPIDYVDKIDVFGYKYISDEEKTIFKYLVIEIKKGKIKTQDILQLMKYVDWVNVQYCNGDYSMIEAYIIGFDFQNSIKEDIASLIERNYIKELRPAKAEIWKNLKLVKYIFENEKLNFELI